MKTPKSITIRSWPKMIFSWPIALFAGGAGMLTLFMPQYTDLAGKTFIIIFAFNMLVLSFEFCRATSLSFSLGSMALVVSLLLINQQFGFSQPIRAWVTGLDMSVSPQFYLAFSGVLFAMYLGMFITTRFDYWQITGNELIHKTGILGDLERYSTSGLKLNKEIHDVFEYLIGGAGRIVLVIPGNPRPVVLENVLGIKKIEKYADVLLNARVVRIETDTPEPPPPPPQFGDGGI